MAGGNALLDLSSMIKLRAEELNKKYYKYCFVPGCKNSSTSSPSKLFLNSPSSNERRKEWNEAARRSHHVTSAFFVCQDHFNLEEDLSNYVQFALCGGRMMMKPTVVPHKFDSQNNLLSIKNLRKLPPTSEVSSSHHVHSEHGYFRDKKCSTDRQMKNPLFSEKKFKSADLASQKISNSSTFALHNNANCDKERLMLPNESEGKQHHACEKNEFKPSFDENISSLFSPEQSSNPITIEVTPIIHRFLGELKCETPTERKKRLARDRKRRQRANEKLYPRTGSEKKSDAQEAKHKKKMELLDEAAKARKRALNAERVRRYRARETKEKAAIRRETERRRAMKHLRSLSEEEIRMRNERRAQAAAMKRAQESIGKKKRRRNVNKNRLVSQRKLLRRGQRSSESTDDEHGGLCNSASNIYQNYNGNQSLLSVFKETFAMKEDEETPIESSCSSNSSVNSSDAEIDYPKDIVMPEANLQVDPH